MIKTKLVFSCFIAMAQILQAHIPTQQETAIYRSHLDGVISPKCISIPEGSFVYCYNPTVEKWLEKTFNLSLLKEIERYLKPHLSIPLTKEGFSQAVATPEGDQFGEVSYSAVWVRDCCWHYYGLKTQNRREAVKLMESLLKFYSSEEQISRFLSVIKNPSIADPSLDSMAHMNVPLIRFSSKTLSHHQFENKDQEWNHLQFDSHGLFLLALSDALSSGILQPRSLTQKNYAVLALFPAFFSQTNYAQKPDAGPWEERLQYNASSAGLIASGIKRIMEVLHSNTTLEQGLKKGIEELKNKKINPDVIEIVESAMSNKNIQHLYQDGLDRVEKNLSFGGEAFSEMWTASEEMVRALSQPAV